MKIRLRKKKPVAAAVILTPFFFAFTSAALAQTPSPTPPTNIGGALEQAAPPPRETPAKPPEILTVVEVEPETLEIPDGETLLVKVFRIENAKEEDWRGLQEVFAPMRFREMTMADIIEAVNQVTAYHRDRGYMTAKAYVPKQDAVNGVLIIRVLFGEYGGDSRKERIGCQDFVSARRV